MDRLIGLTEERIAREQELLARLRGIDVAEPTDWEDVLRVVALLQALGSDDPARRQRAALSAAGDASSPAELLAEAVLHEQDQNVAGALQWALAQAGGEGTAQLAAGLRSPDAEVRRRAVTSIAELPGAEATALLRDALGSGDVVVSRHAALALASRGSDDGLPTLIGMVVDGAGDVEAADALGVLARNPELGERIGTDFSRLLSEDTVDAAVRRRIAQALAEIPGPVASAALARLAQDDDRGVALTASYVLDLRARDRDAAGGGASPR